MATEYMPRDGRGLDVVDPYTHSLQWSRRFIGLKVFMTLAQSGWAGYESTIRHQAEMGVLLKAKLVQAGWQVVNDTPLPVVCFHSGDPQQSFQIAQAVNEGGSSWISGTYLDPEIPVIRACITNFETQPEDLDRLITALDKARNSL